MSRTQIASIKHLKPEDISKFIALLPILEHCMLDKEKLLEDDALALSVFTKFFSTTGGSSVTDLDSVKRNIPTFLGVVHEDSSVIVLDTPGENRICKSPAVVLSLLENTADSNNKQYQNGDNDIRLILQPMSVLGLFLRIAQYFTVIGFNYEQLVYTLASKLRNSPDGNFSEEDVEEITKILETASEAIREKAFTARDAVKAN